MTNSLKTYYLEAKEACDSKMRIIGEMSRALHGVSGSERLMEYETWVNDVFVTHPVTAICQYDASGFDGAALVDDLKGI